MAGQPVYTLLVVAGAPGSGKTTAVAQLLAIGTPFTVLDIDWLIDNASALAGQDIHFAPATWPAYNALWFDFLYALLRNGQQPIFFTTGRLDASPPWCQTVHHLLLDCPPDIQHARLAARSWPPERVEEALADAAELREQIATRINTAALSPTAVAAAISRWATRRVGDPTG
ncbi:MAG: hypothetical protein H6651_18200 [Ardenticatenales bacterium]|nr:hypothetical protein [Ardenticatenales bacterium]